jgi:hypothetical protein
MIYVGDVDHDNEKWKLFTYNDNDCKAFYKNHLNNINININNIYADYDINKQYLNFKESMIFSNEVIYSQLKKKKWSFIDIRDNKFYDVFDITMSYNETLLIYFWCNKEDPFIMTQFFYSMDFFYIFYPLKKEIVQISRAESGHSMFYSRLLNDIKKYNFNKNNIEIKNNILFFGFLNNINHNIWNEISGLYYFLENKNYHDNIDSIIIGPYDFFNIEIYLKNNFKFKIIKFEDIYGNLNHNISNIDLNYYPVFLYSFYIDKNIKYIFDEISNNHLNQINNNIKINNIIEISLALRTNRRILLNLKDFYIKLIKELFNHFNNYNLKINFVGDFININKESETYKNQNNIINDIINNLGHLNNIILNNFIGYNFYEIKNNIINSHLMFGPIGVSCLTVLSHIYNKKLIYHGPISMYQHHGIDNILGNNDTELIPPEYIINSVGDSYEINIDLTIEYIKQKLEQIIK